MDTDTKEPRNPRYLSRKQASQYLGISERLFDKWVAERRFCVVKASSRIIVDRLDLDRYYHGHKQPAAAT